MMIVVDAGLGLLPAQREVLHRPVIEQSARATAAVQVISYLRGTEIDANTTIG